MTTEPPYRLVYASAATQLFSKSQLVSLLEHARAANQAQGITGMLLYKDGNFIQLIEGLREHVQALYARIVLDSRHHRLEVVFVGDAESRLFSDWSMGFRDLSDPALRTLPAFNDFMNRTGSSASELRDPQGCLGLLRLFRSTM